SDWTQHHILFPASKNLAVMTRIQKDPRYTQDWYLRHREVWWPGAGHKQLRSSKDVHRDWSETLGNTYGNYAVSQVTQTGTTVTITTAAANGFASGPVVAVTGVEAGSGGCTQAAAVAIGQDLAITAVTSSTTFTLTSPVSATIHPGDCDLVDATATGLLPATTFEPIFDFSVNMGLKGFGTINTLDLLAQNQTSGQYLATSGALTATSAPIAGYTGTYNMILGGPAPIGDRYGSFVADNLLFPLYPDHSVEPLGNFGLGFDDLSNNSNELHFLYYEGILLDYFQSGTQTGTDGGGLPFFSDPGGGQTFPAKYTFDVTAAPSCTGDYVAMGIPANAVAGGQPNIVGYNDLYTGSSPTGICSGTGPTLMFAYASAGGSTPGEVPGSISISTDGTQLAYIEDEFPSSSNSNPSSYFHVLMIGTSGTNGSQSSSTSAPVAVAPGAAGGNNASDTAVQLTASGCTNQGSTTSPYIDFADNTAFVTTYAWSSTGAGSGCLYKIINVFGDTGSTVPTIQWSVSISAAPSSPVFDNVTGKVFFTDSNGNIDFVTDDGLTASGITSLSVASGSTSENPVTIDSTDGMVYATFNTNGTHAVVVQAPETLASFVSASVGLGTTVYTGPYGVDFSNAWYTSGPTATGALLYVAGTDATTGEVPTLYNVGFNTSTGVMNAAPNSSTALATTDNALTTNPTVADASPVTEFYNATTSTDYLFVGVTNSCAATTGGGVAGCVMSLNITNGAPTVLASTVAISASAGSTGIIVDNDASSLSNPQASSVYYGTKNAGTLVKATQSGLE
ncbi:MAG: hypothetical protein WAV06_02275, partial [Terracidiphilus sp.]